MSRRLAVVSALVLTTLSFSQTVSGQTHLSVATDVTPWLLDGYSAIVMAEGKDLGPWRLTAEVWGMKMPQFHIELATGNQGEDWQRRVDWAAVLYGDYHLGEAGMGWHVGGVVHLMKSTVTRTGRSGQGKLQTLELLARAGYRWFPLEGQGLFLNPWLAAGYLHVIETPKAVAGEVFEELPVQFLGTMHVGWRF